MVLGTARGERDLHLRNICWRKAGQQQLCPVARFIICGKGGTHPDTVGRKVIEQPCVLIPVTMPLK